MSYVEVEQFSLREGASREAFLEADAAVQVWSYLSRPGLARRTTAVAPDGEILVTTVLFGTSPSPSPSPSPAPPPPSARAALADLIDAASYRCAVYDLLD